MMRFRCPSCYTEYESKEKDAKCSSCKITGFVISESEEPAKKSDGKEKKQAKEKVDNTAESNDAQEE